MLNRLREHFGTAGLLVAIVALIAALAGGAYAATSGGAGNDRASTSAKAKQGPRGPRGKQGKPGPQGPAGPTGATGQTGAKGENGSNGSNGKSVTVSSFDGDTEPGSEPCEGRGGTAVEGSSGVTFVCSGEKGDNGTQGNPWAPESELPSGATETGAWSMGHIADISVFPGPGGSVLVPISFTVSLEAADAASTETHVILNNGKEITPGLEELDPTQCNGSAAEPSAEAGHLCIYAGSNLLSPSTPSETAYMIPGKNPATGESGTVSSAGALLRVSTNNVNGDEAEAFGTWAVTAE